MVFELRIILKFILFVLVFLSIVFCKNSSSEYQQSNKPPAYKSFRDIPGVTDAEIEAVEALKAKNTPFIYGMPLSIEGFYSQNGEITGYTALLCKHLTEMFGINFKPAIYEWDDLISGLANGDVDFTGDLTSSEERRKTYYMTDAIVERTLKYFRLKDAMPISRIATSRLPRFGFLEGAITFDMVSLLSSQKFEAFFLPSHNAVHDALISGQIDAFLDENGIEIIFDHYDDMASSDFLPLIYVSASLSTQKSELEPIISIVQKLQNSSHSKYLLELYNQGYQEYSKAKLERKFSEEEREYIKQNPVVRFAAEFDNYPISFYNKHENKWQGVVFDMLEKVETLTGLTFEVANAPNTNWTELLEKLESGDASMISELLHSKDREGRFLWSEIELMQDDHALVSKLEYPDIEINEILYKKVGLTKGSVHAWLFNNWFPNHSNTVVFENAEDAFNALELGEIDLFMSSQNMVLTMTNYVEQPGYKVNILFDNNFGSSLGFNKNERILRSIVDKSLKHLDIKRISDKWKHKSYDYRIKLLELQKPLLMGIFALLFCIIILLLVLYRTNRTEGKRLETLVQKRTAQLNEQNKIMEYMSLTDQLTGLPNRRNFDMRLDIEWRIAVREKQSISFLMIDIDYFKKFNDRYGHQQGDNVLRIIAKTISQTLKRPGDFAARWGGEEFAVLLSNTNAKGALKVAENIRANIENKNVPMDDGSIDKLTVSIGVDTQEPEQDSSLDTFIFAADKELYKAKEMGRNKVCVH
jgi:diguanylate cyclase (GGDEF)-like protein